MILIFIIHFLCFIFSIIYHLTSNVYSIFGVSYFVKLLIVIQGCTCEIFFIIVFYLLVRNLKKYHRLEYEDRSKYLFFCFIVFHFLYFFKSSEYVLITICTDSESNDGFYNYIEARKTKICKELFFDVMDKFLLINFFINLP